jgi:hypothetical protein
VETFSPLADVLGLRSKIARSGALQQAGYSKYLRHHGRRRAVVWGQFKGTDQDDYWLGGRAAREAGCQQFLILFSSLASTFLECFYRAFLSHISTLLSA